MPAWVKQKACGLNAIEYKRGKIFWESKGKIRSGSKLREIIGHSDESRFCSKQGRHGLAHLYEAKIRNMGNVGRISGQYCTPGSLIRAIVWVVKPKIGEKICGGACGAEGLLR